MTTLDLARATRPWLPLRAAFLHPPKARGGTGPLAAIVESRRETALDLLLFAHAMQPIADDPIVASSSAWASANGLPKRPGNRALVSRSWTWLESQRLVRTVARGQWRGIQILREDGSGAPWISPHAEQVPYFRIPHAYWHAGFARDLSLQAKAILLIALSLQPESQEEADADTFFELPVDRGSQWYGLSQRTVRRGLRELRAEGLLRTWVEERESPRSPIGKTFDRRHSLNRLEAIGDRRHQAAALGQLIMENSLEVEMSAGGQDSGPGLLAALRRLDDRDQALLRILARDPSASDDELAAALGISVAAIRTIRVRALSRLRHELARVQIPAHESADDLGAASSPPIGRE